MKKTCNPFKIKITWVLGGLLAIYSFFSLAYFLPDFWDIVILIFNSTLISINYLTTMITHFVLGFLLGWLIKCLFFKK